MCNVIVKSDQRRNDEFRIAESFGVNMKNAENRELIEHVAARSREAYTELKHMEARYK